MDRYDRCQIIATIALAIFIVSFSLTWLGGSKKVYSVFQASNKFDEMLGDYDDEPILYGFEAELNYKLLNEEFTAFGQSRYELPTYSVTGGNIDKLSEIKKHYSMAKIMMILSLLTCIYCYYYLSKRRMFSSLMYGPIMALALSVIGFVRLILSSKPELAGIREMILHDDYSYFLEGDLIKKVMYGSYARFMAIGYVVIMTIVILVVLLIRWLINRFAKPYRF